jgi:mitochondrial import inner membrane translocase subunit TIM21
MVDAHGQEHMIMTFYVQGSAPGTSSVSPEASYFDLASEWVQDKVVTISEMSLEESRTWAEKRTEQLWEKTKRLFRYLSGAPTPPPPLPSYPDPKAESSKAEESIGWSITGMFGSLRGAIGNPGSAKLGNDGRMFTDGEVHAHFVRVSFSASIFSMEGQF